MNLVLNHEGYEDYLVEKYDERVGWGIHYVFRFENNYGASVIKTSFSYGGRQDLWELAVIVFDGESDDYGLTYETEITDDVVGDLTDEEVRNLLGRIKGL